MNFPVKKRKHYLFFLHLAPPLSHSLDINSVCVDTSVCYSHLTIEDVFFES